MREECAKRWQWAAWRNCHSGNTPPHRLPKKKNWEQKFTVPDDQTWSGQQLHGTPLFTHLQNLCMTHHHTQNYNNNKRSHSNLGTLKYGKLIYQTCWWTATVLAIKNLEKRMVLRKPQFYEWLFARRSCVLKSNGSMCSNFRAIVHISCTFRVGAHRGSNTIRGVGNWESTWQLGLS